MAFSILWMTAALFFGPIKRRLIKWWKRPAKRILMITVCVILSAILLYAAVVSGFMLHAAHKTPPENATVVVLGCKVNGVTPSLMLTRRLEAACDYLTAHPDAVCIVSGGRGSDEQISEAQAMFNYLTARGIDEDRIFREDRSTTTEENLRYSREIIEREGLPREIAIATDGFHQLRASIFAGRQGLSAFAISADTPWYTFSAYYARELVALIDALVLKH